MPDYARAIRRKHRGFPIGVAVVDLLRIARDLALGKSLSIQRPGKRRVVDLYPAEHPRAHAHVVKLVARAQDRLGPKRDRRSRRKREHSNRIGRGSRLGRKHGGRPRALAVKRNGSHGKVPGVRSGKGCVYALVLIQRVDDLGIIGEHLRLTRGALRLGVLILFSAAGRKQGRGGRSHAAAKKPSSAYARFTN